MKTEETEHDGLYTDGGCRKNGSGGWGAVYVVGGRAIDVAQGREQGTTNNRMELTAVIRGLIRLVPKGTSVVVFSDSQYVVGTATDWMWKWEKKEWKVDKANLDLVRRLHRLILRRPEVGFQWVPGHSGVRWNEYADRLASTGL